ncbi:DUF2076 domain-containing protein [Kaistia dalseonensis]|uniref:DUF2076 domain-containing protein n=1 Tax=Kaistia dalseonensis TaxID=410840 RepID=A0ABU0HAI4_9HYPH|nr:DUF2076 domain-containing protein [Kaistia dalseonensis]MCX5495875.1 DUF2076 domain-containing protein [Kaistia dalseonensis]MDQ0438476.1 hypothetical protein [Kaistia dalseonensis]
MDTQDRQAIDGLFSRLGTAERQAGPQDPEAEAFIRDRVGAQPKAPYFMAQTIVMQDYALRQAEARIAELEEANARPAQGGGLLSGLFGGGRNDNARRSGTVPNVGRAAPDLQPPYQPQQTPFPQQQQPGRGGGFLAGAAQTAMGVAGGVLLGNAIGSMFSGGGEAQAAEPASEPAPEPEAAASEDGGGFFDSFFGGGGDEDF